MTFFFGFISIFSVQHFEIILSNMKLSEPFLLQLSPELRVLVLGYLFDDPSHCSFEHPIRKVCKSLHDEATLELFGRKHVNLWLSRDVASHISIWPPSPGSSSFAFILLLSLWHPHEILESSWASFCTSHLAPFLSHAEETTVVYWKEHSFDVRMEQRRNKRPRLLSSKMLGVTWKDEQTLRSKESFQHDLTALAHAPDLVCTAGLGKGLPIFPTRGLALENWITRIESTRRLIMDGRITS
ncbi:hypothetical protein AUEXF2481DRAFT_462546 [Aureobasidium subglaciale EXF-2481]|uniref:Uncharacterized protein n=1 Tax=Aureobasidium subglaciale (strain EXF-2481) TaxID=1043005 RepID=A0A074Y1J0_AURSE|nr:uncharacterized protein AUEXF2481DRAFT_462546 [Aureobasidium subglaciale EXF-2481]KEQ91590.1 hypothetical protein AUEXF2481DRAFT_462546 [Aureobasidium subglaciale EXF-2481]